MPFHFAYMYSVSPHKRRTPVFAPAENQRVVSPARMRACLALVFTLVSVLGATEVSAQALVGGGRSSGMGNATTALRGDAWASSNPSTLGTLSGRAVSFFTSQTFGLSELQYSAFQYVEPFGFGSIGASISTFGFADYRDTRLGLTFARGFTFGSSRKAYLGVDFFYGQVAISEYGSTGLIGVSFGGLVEVSDVFDFGFSIQNLNSPSLGEQDELPRVLSTGIQYSASDVVSVVADVQQEVDRPLMVRGGIEFHPVRALYLRTGVGTKPTRFSGGVGVRAGLLAVDIAAQRHDILGWTPAGGLSLLW